MERTLHLLVVGPDPSLRGEFESAASSLMHYRPAIHYVESYRQGVELARTQQPDIVFVAMGRDQQRVKTVAEEVMAASPEAVVVALFGRTSFSPDQSEALVIIEAMRARIGDFLRRPLSSTELEELFERLAKRTIEKPSKLGKIVSFISNKGGVGKTTMAVNTACGLAVRNPDRVLLIDLSLQLGLCSFMLDLEPQSTVVDAARENHRLDETMLRQLTMRHRSGLRLLAAPMDAVEAAEVDDDSVSRILRLARRTFDFVVVDSFPILDSVAVAILDLTDQICVVLQRNVPIVVGTARLLSVLDGIGVSRDRQRILVNQVSPGFAGELRISDVEGRLGLPVDYTFPFQKKNLVAMNTGEPYILGANRMFGFGRTMDRLILDIERGAVVGGKRAPGKEKRTPVLAEGQDARAPKGAE